MLRLVSSMFSKEAEDVEDEESVKIMFLPVFRPYVIFSYICFHAVTF